MAKIILVIAVTVSLSLACNLSKAPAASTSAPLPALTLASTGIGVLPTAATSAPATSAARSSTPGAKLDLLIVTPAEFLAPLQHLAEWKNSTGLSTGILTLEDAYQMCPGRDAPEQIKRCLSLYQKQSGIRYAMLVGDVDKFPVRWTTYTAIQDEAATIGHIEYTIADLYYADLYKSDGSFDDWDSNGNGLYGEIGGLAQPIPVNADKADANPDIAVGRVPVSNETELQLYTQKVISYESGAAGSDWARRILAIVTGGLFTDDCKNEEKALANFPPGWDFVKLYNQGNSCQATPPVTAVNILAEMDRGVGFVSYLGHGTAYEWSDTMALKDFLRPQNAGKLPIIFSGGCDTGAFANNPPFSGYLDMHGTHHLGRDTNIMLPEIPPAPAPLQVEDNIDGLMELSLVQSANGSVAFIGPGISGNFGPMFELNEYFFAGVAAGQPTVGEAWNFAVRKYYQTTPPKETSKPDPMEPIYRFRQPWIFLLFGDPSLRIGGVANAKS